MRTLLIVSCALVLAGCKPTQQQVTSEKQEDLNYSRVDPANAAEIRGVVRFAGKKPPAKRISMHAEEACEALHDGGVVEPSLVTGRNGAVANAFVYIKNGLEGKRFQPPQETVVLDQEGCMFVPRVVALHTGQTLSVKNSDPVSHNIHPMPKLNREWNQHQAPNAPDLQRRFMRPEILIPVKCNVHSWMRSYISVLDHPYFAVTGMDGSYSFPNVPPGNYTVALWHEVLGEMTRDVVVKAKDEKTVPFTFE